MANLIRPSNAIETLSHKVRSITQLEHVRTQRFNNNIAPGLPQCGVNFISAQTSKQFVMNTIKSTIAEDDDHIARTCF
jgi:hypothetical protein